jgi:hypothetical protein
MSEKITTTELVERKREQDGRYALQMKTMSSVRRQQKRDEDREARRLELVALYGDDWVMYA